MQKFKKKSKRSMCSKFIQKKLLCLQSTDICFNLELIPRKRVKFKNNLCLTSRLVMIEKPTLYVQPP